MLGQARRQTENEKNSFFLATPRRLVRALRKKSLTGQVTKASEKSETWRCTFEGFANAPNAVESRVAVRTHLGRYRGGGRAANRAAHRGRRGGEVHGSTDGLRACGRVAEVKNS